VYRIRVSLERDGCHVVYELKDPGAQGGGQHYVVYPTSGKVFPKKYEQWRAPRHL
jgi:hypothetical protein